MMASDGDTITYSDTGSNPFQEDISNINSVTVDYIKGGGAQSGDSTGGSGGLIEGTVIDVSSKSTLYIWVGAQTGNGDNRYSPGSATNSGYGAGSSELSFSNTDESDSSDEPFLAGAGGGGGGYTVGAYNEGAGGGSRGGDATAGADGSGVEPPLGGTGAPDSSTDGGDGDAAVDDQDRGFVVQKGTITKGGGASAETDGEVKLSFSSEPAEPAVGSVVKTDSLGVKQTDGSGVVQTQA